VIKQHDRSVRTWAKQFSKAKLGDKRRTRRLVHVACSMALDPQGSIPRQNHHPAAIKGAYRLFDCEDVTFESVSQAHWDQTRKLAGECAVTLMIQDTTYLSYLNHPATEGLGRFGRDSGWGAMLHSVLAVEPQEDGSGRVLGVAHAKLWARDGEVTGADKPRAAMRNSDDRESLRWAESVEKIGTPSQNPSSQNSRYIHIADRESDIFDVYEQCIGFNSGFVIRLTRQRNACVGHHPGVLTSGERPATDLKQICRKMPKLGTTQLWIAPRGGRPGRWATLALAGGEVTVYSPWFGTGGSRTARPLCCWAVRVWEINPPPGTQPLEWLLLTSEPVNNLADALRVSKYYSLRWMIEEYHQCLKSGCRVEQRQLESIDRLGPFIGIATAVATRLLQLKNDARLTPDRPAMECVDPELVQLLCRIVKAKPPKMTMRKMTIRQFTHEVARMGGFMGRKRDGDPGWKTLWQGWHQLTLIHRGFRLGRE
jgi:hypothetical protein